MSLSRGPARRFGPGRPCSPPRAVLQQDLGTTNHKKSRLFRGFSTSSPTARHTHPHAGRVCLLILADRGSNTRVCFSRARSRLASEAQPIIFPLDFLLAIANI